MPPAAAAPWKFPGSQFNLPLSVAMLFKKGDAVEVTGVKVQFEGVETIFAREVTRDGATFVFRDKAGSPVW